MIARTLASVAAPTLSLAAMSLAHAQRIRAASGMEFIIAQVAKSNGAASKATPESLRLVEPSLLAAIKSSGFVERAQ